MTTIRNPSTPKDRTKILPLEGISDTAAEVFTSAGYQDVERLSKALDGPELAERLKSVRILGIRSRTQLTSDVIAATDRLIAVGCFSVGTNQVDLVAANAKAIPVFNAPFSNTRSVAELTIAEIVMLFRRIFPRSTGAHTGAWDKSGNGADEVRVKTIGIVGRGNIDSQRAVVA